MGLSSNSLIHFTKQKNSLIGILQDNFKIYHCVEHIDTSTGHFEAAIPMVSFCDIPLSEIKSHIDNYGCYGLGLKKSWAIRKGLNPVLYIEKESDLGGDIKKTVSLLLKNKDWQKLTNEEFTFINLFRYMKNYQNNLSRNGRNIPNYRFSDEREWRYVPPKNPTVPPVLPLNLFDNNEKKDIANKGLEKMRLEFTPDDISYIIINDESEIGEFINVLRYAKGKNYTHEQVERLMTRIFTTEQIKTDI